MSEHYQANDWDGKTDGTPWMQRSLVVMLRFLPLWFLYGVMSLVIPFYVIFDRRAFKSSYSFFRNRLGRGPVRSFISIYVAEFRLGQVVLDRFAIYAGRRFDVIIDGNELFTGLAAGEKGFIQLSSHIGNYELAGYSLKNENKKFYALVAKETVTVMKNRAKLFDTTNIEMIPVSEDLTHIFLLNAALSEGSIVSMSGDRVFGSQKCVSCNFFGENANFPAGPFVFAVQKDVPVLSVFVMKESLYRYHIYIHRIDDESMEVMKRAEKISALASAFAAQLEKTVRNYPTQWFNFFDFWKQ